MLKNKIVLILLMFALALPITVNGVNGEIFSEPLENPAQVEETVSPAPVETQEGTVEELPPELNDPNSYTFKPPVSKKKIAKKFILAMLGVAVSSIVLFVLLTLYNKVRETIAETSGGVQNLNQKEEETSLRTPETLTEAVKTFIDKTKWG